MYQRPHRAPPEGRTALRPLAESEKFGRKLLADARHTALPRAPQPDGRHLACAILDSLTAHVAVIDESGTIIAINRAWRDYSHANGAGDSETGLGVNYLIVCARAAGRGDDHASAFAAGVREVLAGECQEFTLEYPCHSPSRRCWYNARITPLLDDGARCAVVAHEDISHRMLEQEGRLTKLNSHLERRVRQLTALRKIDVAIAASADRRLTLGVVVEQAVEQLGVDAADVVLCDQRSRVLDCVASQGLKSATLAGALSLLDHGSTVKFLAEKRAVCVQDLGTIADENPRAAALVADGFVFHAAVPLGCRHEVGGVLEVFCRGRKCPEPEWFEFFDALAGQASIATDNAAAFDCLRRSNADMMAAYEATIDGWSRALDMRDRVTDGHSQRVSEMTVRLARAMGVAGDDLVHLRRGALLHDIGKMGIPDAILSKPGPLTEQEWVMMKEHPNLALEMLSPIVFLHPALDIPYCHHEKWDGTGYPRGLKGDEIPLAARIFTAVDIWDALSSDRPYHTALEPSRVVEHIRDLAGTHLDSRVVEKFLPLITPPPDRAGQEQFGRDAVTSAAPHERSSAPR